MTNETSTTTAPRFTRAGAMLAEPLGPRLAAQLKPAERKKHEAIAQRLAESSRRLAELRAQIAEAPRVDKAKAAEAVARGEDVPPASVERLKAEYAEQQRVHSALTEGLRRSADELLAVVHGRALPVADELDAEIAGAVADVRGDLEATRERLLALAALLGEASWTRAVGLREGGSVAPFHHGGGSTLLQNAIGELRTAREALEHDLNAYEERRREAREWHEQTTREERTAGVVDDGKDEPAA